MSPPGRAFLPGRVARRVFLLFLLSAIVPLAVMAFLSLGQVRDSLLELGEKRVAASAKSYGMAVFERLLLASDMAAAAAGLADARLPAEALARRAFVSLGTYPLDGKGPPLATLGAPPLPPAKGEAASRLAQGRAAIVVFRGGASFTRVMLFVPAPGPGRRVVTGELNPAYLWGSDDQFPAATTFCVFAEDSHAPLFCPGGEARLAVRAVDTAPVQSALRRAAYDFHGETLRAVAWPQFMGAAFGTADWVVVASQPESFQLGPVAEFRALYIPVVAVALLLVAWLTIRQSRHILVPVERLATRARAIAQNDFASRLDMRRDDEFGELGDAFDQMTGRLGRQFATLTALSEIDRLILSTADTGEVVRTVLERLEAMLHVDALGVTLFDDQSPDRARTFVRSPGAAAVEIVRQEVPEPERAALESHAAGRWLGGGESWPGFLAPLERHGAKAAFVQPVVWRGSLCGALALGWRERPAADGDEERQAREFADRVAVAVSSAWRDERLYLQAHYDQLTGLPNRLLFRDRLEREIVRSRREQASLAVLFIDLDNFKGVNDSWGHTAGDEVLREAAHRIARCVRASDTVSRHGGDEFTVLLTHVPHPRDASRVAGQIADQLAAPFTAAGQQAYLSASIGIASCPGDGDTAEELLRNADTAMYRAKAAGRAAIVYFEERMNAEALARQALDRDLRLALQRGELRLHYQPLVEAATGRVRSAEALMRWEHPERGLIPPARFIPLAEETGVIEALGQFAIAEACRQVRAWSDEGLEIEHVAVNVSPRQFRNGAVADHVRRAIAEACIAPHRLQLEITEGILMDKPDMAESVLRSLTALGVSVALDDFGTGFSSMAYLRRYPVHAIKIDRAFVNGLGQAADSEAIVAAMLAMSRALGKRTVAEGVETAEQLATLSRLGCDLIQGYLFAPAMPADDFARYCRSAVAAD